MDLNETGNSHVQFYPYTYNQNQNQNQNHRSPQQPSSRQYTAPPVQYKWDMSQWSECNNLCDGEQFRTAACIQIDAGRHVSSNMCREQKPDDEYQVCNAGCTVELVFICSHRKSPYEINSAGFLFQMGNSTVAMFSRMWRRCSATNLFLHTNIPANESSQSGRRFTLSN